MPDYDINFITPTTITQNIFDIMEANILRVVSLLDAGAIKILKPPPITTEADFVALLANVDAVGQRFYDVWFIDRMGFTHDPVTGSTAQSYKQLHIYRATHFYWGDEWAESYRESQLGLEKMLYLIHKNLDLTFGADADAVVSMVSRSSWSQFGEMFFHRSDLDISLQVEIAEARSWY